MVKNTFVPTKFICDIIQTLKSCKGYCLNMKSVVLNKKIRAANSYFLVILILY